MVLSLNCAWRVSLASGLRASRRHPDVSRSSLCTRSALVLPFSQAHLATLSNMVSASPLSVATESSPWGFSTTMSCESE